MKRPPLDSVIFDDVWYLERIAIDPEFQNQGLGTVLIEWIVKYLCRGRGGIVLEPSPLMVARNKNGDIDIDHIKDSPELKKSLIRFYERAGFFSLWATPYMYRVVEWKKGVRAV